MVAVVPEVELSFAAATTAPATTAPTTIVDVAMPPTAPAVAAPAPTLVELTTLVAAPAPDCTGAFWASTDCDAKAVTAAKTRVESLVFMGFPFN